MFPLFAALNSPTAFDISGQLEEIFEVEGDEMILKQKSSEKNASKARNSDLVAQSASPQLKKSCEVKEVSEDMFGDDSFAKDISAIDDMMRAHDMRQSPKIKESPLKAKIPSQLPKTPNLLVCSEDLDLILADSSVESHTKSQQDVKTTKSVNVTLSDSFLERAMNTHMSDLEESSNKLQENTKQSENTNPQPKGKIRASNE